MELNLIRDFRVACPGWHLYTPEGRRAHETFFVMKDSAWVVAGLYLAIGRGGRKRNISCHVAARGHKRTPWLLRGFELWAAFSPGSELFVVYNEQRHTQALGFPALSNRAFIVKMNRLLRF